MVGPVISLSGEIKPLGMTEFIPHKIQPTFSTEGKSDEANHLVKSDPALDAMALGLAAHVPIHFLIHELECEGLVSDKSLVVRLDVGDVRFTFLPIHDRAPKFVHVPMFIRSMLKEFDPVIRQSHRKAVSEALATFLDRATEPGHSAHIFCNDKSIGTKSMDEFSGELEVKNGIIIDGRAEVGVMVAKFLRTSVPVEHGGDAIEAEAVEFKLLEPVAEVGKEKLADFWAAVVEAFRIPLRVAAAFARMKIKTG